METLLGCFPFSAREERWLMAHGPWAYLELCPLPSAHLLSLVGDYSVLRTALVKLTSPTSLTCSPSFPTLGASTDFPLCLNCAESSQFSLLLHYSHPLLTAPFVVALLSLLLPCYYCLRSSASLLTPLLRAISSPLSTRTLRHTHKTHIPISCRALNFDLPS